MNMVIKRNFFSKENIKQREIVKRKLLKKSYIQSSPKISVDSLLTSAIWKKAKLLPKIDRLRFILYVLSDHVEYLPNGIPYKVIDHPTIQSNGGMYLHIESPNGIRTPLFNKPLILVSNLFPEAVRRNIAMHEYTEWARYGSKSDTRNRDIDIDVGEREYDLAHSAAIKTENPRLRLIAQKVNDYYTGKYNWNQKIPDLTIDELKAIYEQKRK